jgi:hypothetical protein
MLEEVEEELMILVELQQELEDQVEVEQVE